MALWGFIVDDCFDTLYIETTRGQIGGEEEIRSSVSEALNALDTL